MTHGYNAPLLDYDIAAAAGTGNRGARTPAKMGNEITRKLREASDFAQAAIAYAQDIQQQYANQHRQPRGAFKSRRPRVVESKECNYG